MQERYTVRIYDSNLVKSIEKLFSELGGAYTSKNPFLVDCIKKGMEAIQRERRGIKNIDDINDLYDEINKTTERLNSLIKLSEDNAKETIANLTVNQKLLSSNYNMLLGLSENAPKKRDYVESGVYDDLPTRLEDILQEVLEVYLKK